MTDPARHVNFWKVSDASMWGGRAVKRPRFISPALGPNLDFSPDCINDWLCDPGQATYPLAVPIYKMGTAIPAWQGSWASHYKTE